MEANLCVPSRFRSLAVYTLPDEGTDVASHTGPEENFINPAKRLRHSQVRTHGGAVVIFQHHRPKRLGKKETLSSGSPRMVYQRTVVESVRRRRRISLDHFIIEGLALWVLLLMPPDRLKCLR
jgi:hypothetical protein